MTVCVEIVGRTLVSCQVDDSRVCVQCAGERFCLAVERGPILVSVSCKISDIKIWRVSFFRKDDELGRLPDCTVFDAFTQSPSIIVAGGIEYITDNISAVVVIVVAAGRDCNRG